MAEDSKPEEAASTGFVLGWIAIAAVAVITAGGIVLARSAAIRRQSGELTAESQRGPMVPVTALVRAPLSRQVTFPGEIHGFFETPIYGKVSGYVKSMLVDKGAIIRAGQLVALIDAPELDHQVDTAKATYEIDRITDDRNQVLVKQLVVPQQTADESHAAMLEALHAWQSLKAQQAYERVIAPYDGMIVARNLDPGALVATASAAGTSNAALYELATLKPLRTYVYLPQALSPLVKDGDGATVVVNEYPQREFTGSITRHPHALDQSTRTMLIEVDLPNQDLALYPGMYSNVTLSIKGSNGLPKVPDQSLIFNNDKVYVPVVRDDRIHLTEIRLGFDDGINCEVTHGLQGDERVALGMGQTARDGESVRSLMVKSE
jgi:membrane fusion protein (multidrug efflux system)